MSFFVHRAFVHSWDDFASCRSLSSRQAHSIRKGFMMPAGLTRERLIVAYVRHNNCLELILNDNRLQDLCRKTGYIPGTRLPRGDDF